METLGSLLYSFFFTSMIFIYLFVIYFIDPIFTICNNKVPIYTYIPIYIAIKANKYDKRVLYVPSLF